MSSIYGTTEGVKEGTRNLCSKTSVGVLVHRAYYIRSFRSVEQFRHIVMKNGYMTVVAVGFSWLCENESSDTCYTKEKFIPSRVLKKY